MDSTPKKPRVRRAIAIKEASLHREAEEGLAKSASETREADLASRFDERILVVLQAAAEKKALSPTVLDLRGIASFTDYFVIASGANIRQVQAIADEVVEQLKKQGTRAARLEGYQRAEWVLLDYGDLVVHVFEESARRFYDLERLWRDAPRTDFPRDEGGGMRDEAKTSK
jgi:ribosome-associated protein